jgi:hypothetical protein
MAGQVWIALDDKERKILEQALANLRGLQSATSKHIDKLIAKLEPKKSYPDITVGVYGGLVQWVSGNPFPVRICDYDGDKADLPDLDNNGKRCSIWFEPASS